MTFVKICGITNAEDALAAVELGADALGFNFYRQSKRFIEPAAAGAIIRGLPPTIWKVGVFVNHSREEIAQVRQAAGIDTVQLHGDEGFEFVRSLPEGRVIKALRIGTSDHIQRAAAWQGCVDYLLYDCDSAGAYGGSGKMILPELLTEMQREGLLKDAFLAGGLTPANIGATLKKVSVFGVDSASGTESQPGKKDRELLTRFLAAVRSAPIRH
jgi:phosphoribosylanthranilate isomerase